MNDTLRIVHMLPSLIKGGAERVVVDLANASARAGHHVTVVAGWKVDEQVLRYRMDPEVRLIYMTETPGGRLHRYRTGLGWTLENRGWLSQQDVLHLHLTQAAVLGTILSTFRLLDRGPSPAIIETYHAVGMKIPDSLRAFHAWNCRRRDAIAVMALDSFWSEFIARNSSLITEMIPNGVDTPVGPAPDNDVRTYLDSIGVPRSAKRIIGTVGQFRADRQPQALARVLIDVLRQMPDDVHALMCGSGPELDKVRRLVADAGFSGRFTLPGLVNQPRLAMSAMSLYLTLNVGTITGIAALEATFCAVPVIALQLDPGHEPNDDDWIWSSSVPEALSQRTISLLIKPKELISLGARQHAYAIAKYSVGTMYRRYVSLYRLIIEQRTNYNLSKKD